MIRLPRTLSDRTGLAFYTMPVVNRVNLDKIGKTLEIAESDPKSLRKTLSVTGEWLTSATSGPQFKATINFEKGTRSLESDSPSFLGREGLRPSPIQYCLTGLSSCFLATYVTIAAQKGVILRRAKITAECQINFARTLDFADSPITEQVKFTLDLDSDSSVEKLREIDRLAQERCPAVYSLTNPIKVSTEILKLTS